LEEILTKARRTPPRARDLFLLSPCLWFVHSFCFCANIVSKPNTAGSRNPNCLARNPGHSRSRQASCSGRADEFGACGGYHRNLNQFQFRTGTWPRPNWSRSGVQLIPRATLRRRYCPSLLLWTVSFRGQSEPRRAGSIVEIWHGGCCPWDHYLAAV